MLKHALLTTALLATAIGISSPAKAAGLVEPYLGAGFGPTSLGAGTGLAFGGGVRFGVETNDFFSALDASASLTDLSGGGYGFLITGGVTVGGTFVFVPLRLFFGVDFVDSYSNATTSVGGLGFKVGAGWYFSEKMLLNVQLNRHLFTSGSGGDYINAMATLSFPIQFETNKVPWRTRYRGEATAEPERFETTPPPPPADRQTPPTAPDTQGTQEPLIPEASSELPPAETPSGEELPPAPADEEIPPPTE